MKAGHLILVAILAVFVLTGCDVETKEKHKKGDFITGGKNWSIRDVAEPKNKTDPERKNKE